MTLQRVINHTEETYKKPDNNLGLEKKLQDV